MSVETITQALALYVEPLITGLSTGQTFDQTPSTIEVTLPAVINVIKNGTVARGVGEGARWTTHNIGVQCLVAEPGTDLATAENMARPYIARFITKFDANRTLAGTCFDSEIKGYEYGEIHLRRDEPGYLGIVFDLEVTEEETGSTIFSSTSA